MAFQQETGVREKVLIRAPQGLSRQMVVDFIERYRTSLPNLRDALDRSDYAQAKVFGHRLSGTGGAYGMPVLTELGAAIEDAAAQKNKSELEAQTEMFAAYLSRLEVLPD